MRGPALGATLKVARGRRYATAGELAEDLERFLEGRPVANTPDAGEPADDLERLHKRSPVANTPGLWDRVRQMFAFKGPARQGGRPSR